MQVTVMLKEVQMPPGFVGKVVSLTGLTALRTGVETTALRLDIEIQSVGRHGGIQVLVLEDPGRFQAQAESQNLDAVHVIPTVVVETIFWPSSGHEFHTQRRRAIFSTSVWANFGNTTQDLPLLERGVSSTQLLAQGQPKRFNMNIEQATTLKVDSDHFPGFTSTGNRISAVLLNEVGQQEAEASSTRGHFELVSQLQPGKYQIDVTGSSRGGAKKNDNNSYELHVTY